MVKGLFVAAYLGLVIWAILNIAQCDRPNWVRVIWILAVIIVPYFGFVLWFAIGPRSVPKIDNTP